MYPSTLHFPTPKIYLHLYPDSFPFQTVHTTSFTVIDSSFNSSLLYINFHTSFHKTSFLSSAAFTIHFFTITEPLTSLTLSTTTFPQLDIQSHCTFLLLSRALAHCSLYYGSFNLSLTILPTPFTSSHLLYECPHQLNLYLQSQILKPTSHYKYLPLTPNLSCTLPPLHLYL